MNNTCDYCNNCIGHVVLSTAGRDAKRLFVVIANDGPDYVLISDGDTHKLSHPKRKKVKHIKPTGKAVPAELTDSITEKRALDAHIRHALASIDTF